MTRILLLGGTTEASLMAQALARAGLDAVFSYAGRTDSPAPQPLATRVGGFGGVPGLVAWLRDHRISHVIDATHPFAAQMSRNAITACAQTGIALVGLERAAWQPGPGDDWRTVLDVDAAVTTLPDAPARVFLAIGKQTLAPFAAKPQHHYLLRLVDPPTGPLPLPRASVVIARGPFDMASDAALLRDHAITHIVAKNAGGTGAEAKLTAARARGLPVILIDRPVLPARKVVATVSDVMAWLGHADTERGV
ncbi:cobalt-precorrin-6A reductase (plasmid) [Gemmobacter aquarius]|uniref:Cobalt-precorrin-6A reductase n=1 Tax=Paragemmobacter aquarius TaxID=2169400 RepID=A0A2S0USD3_9RHOB|nr:cobalt-precorrin-6A reductase [Gemmobacter aquarius]AWB50729.1 cobalt-precorrin-6A reductase [Gemmobacter aquarius]AWB50872.1 cobalt-precorrin-6A reductase [Gemmobacter aquarius]